MRVVVDTVLFFGLSSDETVQPDEAVSRLEAIASTLQELGDADKKEFLVFVENLASTEESEAGSTRRVEFLRALGESLGL
jgi:hypothetical protein